MIITGYLHHFKQVIKKLKKNAKGKSFKNIVARVITRKAFSAKNWNVRRLRTKKNEKCASKSKWSITAMPRQMVIP